jgi:hypothetical protein
MNSKLKTSALGLILGMSSAALFAANTASDTAANYAASWGSAPPNLGSGFGDWSFVLYNANSPPYVGTYLDLASYNNSDGALSGGYAWGTYANGGSGDGSIQITRPFTTGASGSSSLYNQTFSMVIGSAGVGSSPGQALAVNIGTAFGLSYTGGGADNMMLTVGGGGGPIATPVTFGDINGGLIISLSVSGALNSMTEGYTLALSPAAGGAAYYTTSGTFDASAYDTSSLVFIDTNTSNDQFFNNLMITAEVPEPSSLMLLGTSAIGVLAFYRRGCKS